MADTFTEGYRIGFELTGKDLSKKKTVNIRYCLGFERLVRAEIKNLKSLDLSLQYTGQRSTRLIKDLTLRLAITELILTSRWISTIVLTMHFIWMENSLRERSVH